MKKTLKKKNNGHWREANGFSILYVLMIGVVTLMGIMAVTDALVTAQRNVASQVYLNEATSTAENALQYSIGVLNSATNQGVLSTIPSSIPIPNSIMGNATVSVKVTQIPASLLYGSSATPIWNINTFPPSSNQQNPPPYLLVSANSQVSTYRRTINAILGPQFTIPPPLPGSPGSKPPSNAYYNGALYANQLLQISGVNVLFEPGYNATATSFAQPIISSNNSIQLSGSTTIYGSLNANSFTVPQAPLPPGTANPIMIEGNVSYSGAANQPPSAFIADQGNITPTPGANVLGDGLAGGVGNQPGSVTNNAFSFTSTPAQVMSSSGTAQFAVAGTTTTIQAASDGTNSLVSSLGSLSASENGTVSIASGQYVANSVYVPPTGTLNLNLTPSSSGSVSPIQIFLQGNSEQGVPLLLQGNMTTSGAAASSSNLQIFYNGTQSILVTMGQKTPDFYGQIYAPNANVTIDTTGGAFHGAVSANNLTLTGTGNFYYDPRSINPAGGGPGAPGPGWSLSATNPNSPTLFNVLSWQEQTTGAP